MKNILLKITAFIISAVVGFFATDIIVDNIHPKQETKVAENASENIPDSDAATDTTQGISDTIPNEADMQTAKADIVTKPIVLNLGFDVTNKKLNSDKFDFNVNCNNLTEGLTIKNYYLYSKDDTVVPIKRAEADGIFKNVEYKSADGTYLLCAVTSENRLSTLKEIGGFTKPVVVKKIEKMPKEELQKLVDNISAEGKWYRNGGHDQIARNVEIKVKDLANKREFTRIGFSALRVDINSTKKKFPNATVTVLDVKYDNSNKINSVVVELK